MKKYKTIQKTTRELLRNGEGQLVDYKRDAKGLHTEDLIAFANADGGTILIGVEEIERDGQQQGRVVGSKIDDGTLLSIVNKAQECDPPITMVISVENTNKEPLIRIDVPRSPNRPHGTRGGTYKKRDSNRNKGFSQRELLDTFLERESEVFVKRFRTAVDGLEKSLDDVQAITFQMASEISFGLDEVKERVLDSLEHISGNANEALESTEESKSVLEELSEQMDRIENNLGELPSKKDIQLLQISIDSIINAHSLPDPNLEHKLRIVRDQANLYALQANDLFLEQQLPEEFYQDIRRRFPFLSNESINEAVDSARTSNLKLWESFKQGPTKGSE